MKNSIGTALGIALVMVGSAAMGVAIEKHRETKPAIESTATHAPADPKVMSITFADNKEAWDLMVDLANEAKANHECVEITPLHDEAKKATWWLHSCEE